MLAPILDPTVRMDCQMAEAALWKDDPSAVMGPWLRRDFDFFIRALISVFEGLMLPVGLRANVTGSYLSPLLRFVGS